MAALDNVDPVFFAQYLQGLNYRSFREQILTLGGELARRKVEFGSAIAVLDLLLDLYLSNLAPASSRRGAPEVAAVRLYSIIARTLAAGYSRQWDSDRRALVAGLQQAEEGAHQTSQYLTRVYERERRRLSHNLHDGVGHDLILLKLYLEDIAQELKEGDARRSYAELAESVSLVSRTMRSIRRLVVDLGPALIEEVGLIPAVRIYVRQFSSRAGINVTIEAEDLPDSIPLAGQVALYRILQELCDCSKQSMARNIQISFTTVNSLTIGMTIDDDGMGLDLSVKPSRRARALAVLRERIAILGGTIYIHSRRANQSSHGQGTKFEVRVPLHETKEATAGT